LSKKKNTQDELINDDMDLDSEEFPDQKPKEFGFGAFAK